jgi:hypothetical protein
MNDLAHHLIALCAVFLGRHGYGRCSTHSHLQLSCCSVPTQAAVPQSKAGSAASGPLTSLPSPLSLQEEASEQHPAASVRLVNHYRHKINRCRT